MVTCCVLFYLCIYIKAQLFLTVTMIKGERIMKNYFKKSLMIVLALMMVLSLSACGGTDTSSSTTSESTETASETTEAETAVPSEDASFKEVLNIAVHQEAPTYDVHKTTSLVARQTFSGTVWEKLVTLDADANVVPELAASYEISDDAKTFTFHLREGVLFHDGTELTSADVVASMNRWIGAFSTAAKLVGEGRFEAIDDYTVQIVTDEPALTLPDMMAGAAQPAVVTTAAACENEDEKGYLIDYIGTGPYKFIEWVQDQYITLEKFDDYVPYYLEDTTEQVMDGWAGYKNAYTKTLNFYYVPEEATRVAGLQTGQYDVAINLSSDNYDMIDATPDLHIVSEQAGTVALVFNKAEESMASDINLRKAVNSIANSDDILTSAFGSFYSLGSCYMDAVNVAWLTDAGSEFYNLKDEALAKEYLEKAGYNGETFRILAPTINHYDNMALVLKSELESIGMTVEITAVDWATFTQYRQDKEAFDLYITSFASVPVPTLKAYYAPAYPGWSVDDTLSEKLSIFNQATNSDEAFAAWEDLQAYSWDYLPCISAGHYETSYAWNSNVQGLYYGNGLYYWNAFIEE